MLAHAPVCTTETCFQPVVAVQRWFDALVAALMLRSSCTTLHPASNQHHQHLCGIAICQRAALQALQTRSTIVTASTAKNTTSRRTWRTAFVTSAGGAPHVNSMPDGGQPDAEHVSFKDATGNDLIGILTLPGAATAAVLCHGYTSSKDGMHLAALSERLAADGMASLRHCFATLAPEHASLI